MTQDFFRTGMRRLTGAVTIVTTRSQQGERRGATATAVCSLSAQSPSLLTCINRESGVGRLAPEAGIFCVNVLSRRQSAIADTFAGRGTHHGEERFAVGSWREGASGAPVLDGALVSFDCRLHQFISAATHLVLIGHVIETTLGAGPLDPLLYLDGAYTHLGPA